VAKRWDRESIRPHLEQKCRCQIPEPLWELLNELHWIDDVENAEISMEWLIDKARKILTVGSETAPKSFRERIERTVTPTASVSEPEQSEARAEFLGALAAEDARVRIIQQCPTVRFLVRRRSRLPNGPLCRLKMLGA
jgi:hypothetical protein